MRREEVLLLGESCHGSEWLCRIIHSISRVAFLTRPSSNEE